MKSASIHPEALAELDEAMAWYNKQRPGLGLELNEEVQRSREKIEQDPGVGARYQNTEYRFVRTVRFPYVIYYLELPEYIWIAAIAHGRRRANYWKKRSPS